MHKQKITELLQKLKDKQMSKAEVVEQIKRLKAEPVNMQSAIFATIAKAGQQPSVKANDLQDYIQNFLLSKLQLLNSNFDNSFIQDNFLDLGIDSIQLVDLASKIEKELGIELYPTLFIEYPNIEALTEYFLQNHVDRFNKIANIKPETVAIEAIKSPVIHSKIVEKINQPALKIQNVPDNNHDIAIIGMAGLFPEANDLDTFWQHLVNKTDLMREIPLDHWDYRPWFDSDPKAKNKTYCKWGSFINDVDKFDAGFFNISPIEAEVMDPQLRLLLQAFYGAAEDAGCVNTIKGSHTGVYVGACFHDYHQEMERAGKIVEAHDGTGNAATMLSNRPSFFFNLTGPSITLDTACSSSLVALHAACQALRQGECEQAFVGGVNLLLTSWHYRYFCSLGALSATGRCHTFDARGDGYTPGESIVALLLKPLAKALLDGDPIQAVVKGSAVNHGGYTPSVTAPSMQQEKAVVLAAWKAAGISPATIGYIEAHGTGTKLGDPIEVDALQAAFKEHTDQENFCAIGSAKANIGHTEGAAGLVGVVKAVLSIKNNLIPAMPQFKQLNPYIKLDASPLYINLEPVEWKSEKNHPRRAGVSSFGFGGAYAHVVLEEAPKTEIKAYADKSYYLITLSAKHEEILQQQLINMQAYLDKNEGKLHLEDISYTLNTGRNHFNYRAAFVVDSIKNFKDKLKLLQKQSSVSGYFKGNVKQQLEDPAIYKQILKLCLDKLKQHNIETRTEYQENLEALANLYIKGYELDWTLLHQHESHQKISLPTYPFAKQRYWVDLNAASMQAHLPTTAAMLHPLIGYNASTLEVQCYKTTFTAQPFYLRDHQIAGQLLLPGVCYLEMARAAGALANPALSVISLKNIVWLQPISIAQEAVDVTIRLWPKESGQIRYEVVSGGDHDTLVHGQGDLIYGTTEKPLAPVVAIQTLQAQLPQRISQEELYSYYQDKSFCYGPTFQSVQWVLSDGEKALGYLTLPADVQQAADRSHYVLHPSLLDGALQCILGLVGETANTTLAVPFSVEEVKWYAPLPDACYVLIKRVAKSGQGTTQRYNIQVLNSEGQVLVELIKFNVREISAASLNKLTAAKPKAETYGLYTPDLVASPLPSVNTPIEITDILAIGFTKQEQDKLASALTAKVYAATDDKDQTAFDNFIADLPTTVTHVIYKSHSKPSQYSKTEDFDSVNILRWVQALAKSKRYKKLHWVYVNLTNDSSQSAMVEALFKTIMLELPQYRGQSLVFCNEYADEWVTALINELQNKEKIKSTIYYQPSRQHLSWRPLSLVNSVESQLPWRKEGVYLITGGLGGLGMIFARYLAEHYQAKLILTGRSALTEEKQALMQTLETLGSEVLYVNADISRADEVEALIAKTQQRFGHVHGVLHSAGVIQDSLLLSKELNKLTQVLAPKVLGTLYLDQALKDEPLDFMVFFSSITSVLGNIGQSDYAMANAFMDAFAHAREKQVQAGQRQGKTLSINWPLWKDGGMQIKPQMVESLTQATGLVPLSTEIGIQALEQALCQNKRQVLVAEGNLQQFNSLLIASKPETNTIVTKLDNQQSKDSLIQDTQTKLIAICADILKIAAFNIESDTPLSEYGLDSILMMNLLKEVEHTFQCTISPDVLTDYQTIAEFAEYLVTEGFIKFSNQQNFTEEKQPVLEKISPKTKEKIQSAHSKRFITSPAKATSGRIAIIGMAGRFPKSATLEKFWENLAVGENLITEVPAKRWPIENFYQPGKGTPGKTYAKWGGLLDDIEYFAADYFAVQPEDAVLMDPPQRLLLEVAQELLDRAGYTKQEVSGSNTGIFIGGRESDYLHYYQDKVDTIWHKHTVVNNIQNMQAARIADFYNLKGPAYTVDTACSSALVAVHQACQSLLTGESTLAIAGGAEILVGPDVYIGFSQADVLSPEGKSYVFDERANGFVLGEGVGLVLLKPYEQALTDGDQILGTILGSAINNDGHTIGVTVPSLTGQQEVIQKALDKSGISPATISYYEAHGTGTLLGDPIEIKAMNHIYRQYSSEKNYCGVGSIKSNMGHALHAAGIASLIKTVLCMQHQTLVPTLHCEKPHPRFQFEESTFYPITQKKYWEPRAGVRRAAISSFGFGGTNCHMILEEAPHEYMAKRTNLPFTVLNRNYYWLIPRESEEAFDKFYSELSSLFETNEQTTSKILNLLNVLREDVTV